MAINFSDQIDNSVLIQELIKWHLWKSQTTLPFLYYQRLSWCVFITWRPIWQYCFLLPAIFSLNEVVPLVSDISNDINHPIS